MNGAALDVLVLGLGPAGARAAARAARAGCRLLAIDRKRVAGLPVQCAELVPAMIGIEVGNVAGSVRQSIGAMRTFVEDDPSERTEPFPGQMIDRAAFDAALVEEARAAGAQCRFGIRANAIASDGAVALSDGTRVTAKVIVGADGPRSLAGRAIGQVNRALVETRQVTVALREPHDATDIFLSEAIPGGYAWLFPRGEVANLGAGVDSARKGELKAIVERLHAGLAAQGRVGRERLRLTGGAIPVGGALKPWGMVGPTRVLLAGDAAGLAHPVTGAGIAAAVHSGTLAGECAAALVAHGRAAALDGAEALEYETELDALYGAALARAVRRRAQLRGNHGKSALRRAWIAYPAYWHSEIQGERP
jgi:geranylgeranyl reductase family protein